MRWFAALVALILALSMGAAQANTPVGQAGPVQGDARLVAPAGEGALAEGAPLHAGDRVLTGPNALALLMLTPDTTIHLGPDSDLHLDAQLAAMGGTLTLGGALVFDRPEGAAPVDIRLVTAFGEIGVRGTRFFVGPSRGTYAVFVDRGQVQVTGAGVTVDLGAGQGTELAAGQPPTTPTAWGDARITDAFAIFGLAR